MVCSASCIDEKGADKDDEVAASETSPSSVTTTHLNVEVRQGSLPQFSVCSRYSTIYMIMVCYNVCDNSSGSM